MTPLFDKLHLKAERQLVVLDAPASFEPELAALQSLGDTVRVARAAQPDTRFAIAFVVTQAALDAAARLLAAQAADDAVLWFAYPKQSSKKYRCEFHRDSGFDVLGELGYEAVRMVAIDTDWSALRFRKAEHIKTLKRDPSRVRSAAGRQRTQAR
jgi:hypothetical protein